MNKRCVGIPWIFKYVCSNQWGIEFITSTELYCPNSKEECVEFKKRMGAPPLETIHDVIEFAGRSNQFINCNPLSVTSYRNDWKVKCGENLEYIIDKNGEIVE